MSYRAMIHYKNDEEVYGDEFEDFWEALDDLRELLNKEVTSEEGFDPEDVEYIQVEHVA